MSCLFLKLALLCLVATLLVDAPFANSESLPFLEPKKTNWNLIWSDDFNSPNPQINPRNWVHEIGGDGWGNNEQQFYTDRLENSRIEGGHLLIESRKESYKSKNYTSARLISKSKWKYGRFEIRAQLPRGRGSWPAIWMLGSSLYKGEHPWPKCGEIDIMEHVGFDPGNLVSSIHTKAYNWMNKNQKSSSIFFADANREFHQYGIEWFADRIDFFVDDNFYFSFAKEPSADFDHWPFDQEGHLILNNSIGGSWGGQRGIDDQSVPQIMKIDYVRVFQK